MIKSTNSGAKSSNLIFSRTSGDDPVWTLSDEEVTARGQVKDETEFVFEDNEEEKEGSKEE